MKLKEACTVNHYFDLNWVYLNLNTNNSINCYVSGTSKMIINNSESAQVTMFRYNFT